VYIGANDGFTAVGVNPNRVGRPEAERRVREVLMMRDVETTSTQRERATPAHDHRAQDRRLLRDVPD
jgi:hypothetical protein